MVFGIREKIMQNVRLGDLLGTELEEDFMSFDFTEIQMILETLREENSIDISHAEMLQQKALRGADIITDYLGKIVKTVGYLEAKLNTIKNKVSLEYKSPDGSRTTTDMRLWAANCSPEVEEVQIKLSKAKASKSVLEKKFDILIRSHHHYKDIASGLRRTILGHSSILTEKVPEGYE